MDGLVGWWPLTQANYQGGVFVDESGNGNDGTPANVPSFSIDSFRNPTGATEFVAANNDVVNCGNDAVFDFGTDSFSITGWAYAAITRSGFFEKGYPGSGGITGIQLRIGTNNIYTSVEDADGNAVAGVIGIGLSWLNSWNHIAVVVDRVGDTVKLYVNGVYEPSALDIAAVTGSLTTANDIHWGERGSSYLNGFLADARIYNRALSAEEVKLLHTPSLTMALELDRSYGGNLTPTGDLARTLSAYRAFGGTLTPTGDMEAIVTFVQALGGDLNLSGALSASNPAWLLIDDVLTWMGEWDATYGYAIDDVVLYKSDDGNEWHVFISKIGHNVGNIPTSTAAAWRRLYQEKWT